MSAWIGRINSERKNSYTFNEGLDILSGNDEGLKIKINEIASEIIRSTVRSSDEIYKSKPFVALMQLLLTLDPEADLVKTPLTRESILKFVEPNKERFVFRS